MVGLIEKPWEKKPLCSIFLRRDSLWFGSSPLEGPRQGDSILIGLDNLLRQR